MTERPRVVILGGGMAGLTTAWELSRGNWRESLAGITVYQRGWRLGGKGASSRGRHGRIEEHGLHVLLGYYDATFRVLRECYAELDRPRTDPGCPIGTWDEAVRPSGAVGLAEREDARWSHFVTNLTGNDLLPGEPGAEDATLSPIETARRSVTMLLDFHRSSTSAAARDDGVFLSTTSDATAQRRAAAVADTVRTAGLTALALLLESTHRSAEAVTLLGSPTFTDSVEVTLGAVRDGLHEAVLADPAARRTWHLVDLVVTNLRGLLVDGLLLDDGYRTIDHLDYGQWLRRHGAAEGTIASPIVRGMYDLVFGYADGDRNRPSFSAGVGLALAGRMLFDFKGAIFWRMQAGMGEVVFAPLYEALHRRGVEFRFFHRLDEVRVGEARPDSGGGLVDEIVLGRQVEVAAGAAGYRPLTSIGGLPCWPDRPDADQLEPGSPIEDLESHWGPRRDVETVRLRHGVDFDVAVLAVSLGMIPHVCPGIVARDRRWSDMVRRVGTVGTQAFQLWLDADERALGWRGPEGTTLSGFAEPFDTWASMSHLLAHEPWNGSDRPQTVAYFCGALAEADVAGLTAVAAADLVRSSAIRFVDEELPVLWPAALHRDGGFRWDLLHAGADGATGPDRFEAQYWRANVDPSDRYVQSLPGSDRYRLRPGDSGYDNLVLAGDWTDCGLNAGCVEAATRSGVLAARSVLDGALGKGAAR